MRWAMTALLGPNSCGSLLLSSITPRSSCRSRPSSFAALRACCAFERPWFNSARLIPGGFPRAFVRSDSPRSGWWWEGVCSGGGAYGGSMVLAPAGTATALARSWEGGEKVRDDCGGSGSCPSTAAGDAAGCARPSPLLEKMALVGTFPSRVGVVGRLVGVCGSADDVLAAAPGVVASSDSACPRAALKENVSSKGGGGPQGKNTGGGASFVPSEPAPEIEIVGGTPTGATNATPPMVGGGW